MKHVKFESPELPTVQKKSKRSAVGRGVSQQQPLPRSATDCLLNCPTQIPGALSGSFPEWFADWLGGWLAGCGYLALAGWLAEWPSASPPLKLLEKKIKNEEIFKKSMKNNENGFRNQEN